MLSSEQIERLLCHLATCDREALLDHFRTYRSDFPVDLTPDYLRCQTVDKIRHLFFAVCMQNRRLPAMTGAERVRAA